MITAGVGLPWSPNRPSHLVDGTVRWSVGQTVSKMGMADRTFCRRRRWGACSRERGLQKRELAGGSVVVEENVCDSLLFSFWQSSCNERIDLDDAMREPSYSRRDICREGSSFPRGSGYGILYVTSGGPGRWARTDSGRLLKHLSGRSARIHRNERTGWRSWMRMLRSHRSCGSPRYLRVRNNPRILAYWHEHERAVLFRFARGRVSFASRVDCLRILVTTCRCQPRKPKPK